MESRWLCDNYSIAKAPEVTMTADTLFLGLFLTHLVDTPALLRDVKLREGPLRTTRWNQEGNTMPDSTPHGASRPETDKVPRTPQNRILLRMTRPKRKPGYERGAFRHNHTSEPAKPWRGEIDKEDAGTRANQ